MSDFLDFSSFEQAAVAAANNKPTINIRFEKQAIKNENKSLAAGHPVYDEVHMAYLRVPGSRDEFPQKINADFLSKHGPAYEKWKATQEQPTEGTPLELWPPFPINLVEEFKYFGVRSVQQLANISDIACQKMGMGVVEWRKKAQAYLEQAKDGAATQRLVTENEQLKREVERLSRQVQDLAAKASAVPSPTPPAPAVDIAAIAALVAQQMKNGSAQ